MSDPGVRGGFDWEGAEDITVLYRPLLLHLTLQSLFELCLGGYRQRVLQGRIDLIRAELVHGGAVLASPEDLARALMGASGDRRP